MTFAAMPDMIREALQAIPWNPLPVLLFIILPLPIIGTSMNLTPALPIFPQTSLPVAREIATAGSKRCTGIDADRHRETLAHVLERGGAMPALDAVA